MHVHVCVRARSCLFVCVSVCVCVCSLYMCICMFLCIFACVPSSAKLNQSHEKKTCLFWNSKKLTCRYEVCFLKNQSKFIYNLKYSFYDSWALSCYLSCSLKNGITFFSLLLLDYGVRNLLDWENPCQSASQPWEFRQPWVCHENNYSLFKLCTR